MIKPILISLLLLLTGCQYVLQCKLCDSYQLGQTYRRAEAVGHKEPCGACKATGGYRLIRTEEERECEDGC